MQLDNVQLLCEGATGGALVGIFDIGGGPPPTGIIRPLSLLGIFACNSAENGCCRNSSAEKLLLLSAPVLGPNERVNAIGARFDPVVLCLPVYAPSMVAAAAPLLVPLPLPP